MRAIVRAIVGNVRGAVWMGLTLLAAFLLTVSARAAELENRAPVPPSPRAADSPRHEVTRPPARRGAGQARRRVGSPTPYGPLPPPAPPFRDSLYGAHATAGVPGSPGYLHPHYPHEQSRYGIWFQPSSFHEPYREPYRPSPFRPRGWGNLFVDQCQRVRMDYNREVVEGLPSRYGPSYYPNYSQPSECLIRPTRCYRPKYSLGKIWGWCGHKQQRKQRQLERHLTK